jgi:3-oxoacyl-[acyl-carrier protein] reductase
VRADLDAFAVTGDVTRAADLAAMREAIERVVGPVDILVANAGGNPTPPMPVDVLPESVWRETVDLNLTATFLTVQCFLAGMKQRGRGNIVTISSAAARRAHPGSPIAYAAAKAGIELFTQDVAAQMGPHGIRANCVAPETILTERSSARIPDAMKQQMAAQHPLARLGTPEDVARAVAFLASDDASWITGIVVDVAGGAVLPR